MNRFRKRPVEVEAIRWTGDNWPEVNAFLAAFPHPAITGDASGVLGIPTLEGTMLAHPGDWIIRGIERELYPCKPDIFAATYEEVTE